MRGRWLLLGAAVTCLSCSNVLGIPGDTLSFCSQPANQGHTYCEDFDVGDPTKRWTFSEAVGGATLAVEPGSDRSAPNFVDLSAPARASGQSAIAGFDVEFDSATFTGLHIETDMRFVTADGGPLGAVNGGFLLVVDKSGGCVALGLGSAGNGAPVGIGAITFPESTGCSLLNGGGAGGNSAGATPLTVAPGANQWFHILVDVLPDKAGLPGAGTLTLDVVGRPGSTPAVHLGAGTLVPSGIPLVGFAAEVDGPSGPLDVQYDNVTIDVVSP